MCQHASDAQGEFKAHICFNITSTCTPTKSLVLTSSLFMLHNAQKRLCLPSQCSLVLQINMISVAASQAAVWASLLIAAPANLSAKPVQLDLPGDQLHSLGSSLMPILAVLAVPTLAFCLKQGW